MMEETPAAQNEELSGGPGTRLFRVLIEHSHDVVATIDVHGRVLYISPATRRYGRDPAAVLGESIWDYLHPDELPEIQQRFAELVAEPTGTLTIEHRVGGEEAGWRYKETVMQNLLQEPSVQAIVAISHDITERKHAETELRRAHDELEQRVRERTAELRESEARYRRLIEGLDIEYVFYSQTVDGRVEYVSPSVRNVLGYDPDQIRRETFRPYFTDSPINQSLQESFDAAVAGRSPTHQQCELRHADGSPRIFEYLDVPVTDAEGNVIAVEGIARDITARRRAEEALQEANELLEQRVAERTADLHQLNLELWETLQSRERARERLRSIVEDQTEFIVRWRPDGTRTFVNSSYCRFVGQSAEELLGTSFFPLIRTEEERLRVQNLTRELTPEDPVTSYEHQVVCPDGSVHWTQWNDRALFNEHGEIVEFQSVGRDTTDQHLTAERLQRQQEELAHVARVSVMGEMVAAIGHEIGQPLHAISTFASACQRALDGESSEAGERVAQWSGKIQEQVTRASGIIRRLREFTRFAESSPEPFDLNEAITESLDLVRRDVTRNMARASVDLAPGLPRVRADRLQVEQVAVNLLRNACEAMQDTPPEERVIRVATFREGDRATVAVRDRGAGMSDEASQKAFKAFYTTKAEGTGIGLAISRRIVEEYGGRLWATRNNDRGMTFLFTLPLHEDQGENGDR